MIKFAGSNFIPARIGVDLGGSNIYGVAFDSQWQRIEDIKLDTNASEGYDAVLARIKKVIRLLCTACEKKHYRVQVLGLCVPGVIAHESRRVLIAPNLGWKNRAVLDDLKLTRRVPDMQVAMVNDVNAGLMGEISAMPEPPSSAVAFFCGTGIGGAVCLDGRLWIGHGGGAGEVGHCVVRAGGKMQAGGVRGSLEAYIGKWALNARILRALEKGRSTALKDIIKYNLEKVPIKSGSLKKAYLANDAFTQKMMNEYYCRYLGIAIGQVCNLLQPEVIVLGGGIMEAMGTYLMPHIKEYARQHSIVQLPDLRLSVLGDFSGPRGAAYLASTGGPG